MLCGGTTILHVATTGNFRAILNGSERLRDSQNGIEPAQNGSENYAGTASASGRPRRFRTGRQTFRPPRSFPDRGIPSPTPRWKSPAQNPGADRPVLARTAPELFGRPQTFLDRPENFGTAPKLSGRLQTFSDRSKILRSDLSFLGPVQKISGRLQDFSQRFKSFRTVPKFFERVQESWSGSRSFRTVQKFLERCKIFSDGPEAI